MAKVEDIASLAALVHAEINPPPRPDVLAGCFPEALSLIKDKAPMRFALTTRRGAKSYSAFLEIVDDALDHPGADYLVIGLSRLSVRRIFWKPIAKQIDRRFHLNCTFNETELRMEFPNGATVYFLGMDAEDEHTKVLGMKLRKVLVDEAQEIAGLENLVHKVLMPTLMDEASNGSSITCVGTPGNLRDYFYRMTKGCASSCLSPALMREPGWSGHVWETTANPYTRQEYLDLIARYEATIPNVRETTWFQQMLLGRWVVDDSALVYKYSDERNTTDSLPTFSGGSWHYGLALDLGFSPDPICLVVGAWHDWRQTLYLVESFKAWEQDFSATAALVKEYERRFSTEFSVVDGANKQGVAEMNNRHGLSLCPAVKQGKEDAIRLMNDAFVTGRIKLLPYCNKGIPRTYREGQRGVKLGGSLALADEYRTLVWDEKKLAAPYFKHVEHAGLENHGADAALYLFRTAYEFVGLKPADPPEPGSEAYWDSQTEAMYAAEIEAMAAAQADATWHERTGWHANVGLAEGLEDEDPNLVH